MGSGAWWGLYDLGPISHLAVIRHVPALDSSWTYAMENRRCYERFPMPQAACRCSGLPVGSPYWPTTPNTHRKHKPEYVRATKVVQSSCNDNCAFADSPSGSPSTSPAASSSPASPTVRPLALVARFACFDTYRGHISKSLSLAHFPFPCL